MVNHDDESKKPLDQSDAEESGRNEGAPWWQPATIRTLLAKRWALPAIYLTAAALIIFVMYGQAGRLLHNSHNQDQATAPTVAAPGQQWIWPVAADSGGVKLERGYYDASAKGATLQTLVGNLVRYDNSYQGSTGIDLGMPGGKRSFGVVAAASGTVESVQNDPVMGETVTVQSGNGYTETYQSLGSVSVNLGQNVLQGQLLGSSGYNMREASLGNHLLFEIQKNNAYVDPEQLLPQASV